MGTLNRPMFLDNSNIKKAKGAWKKNFIKLHTYLQICYTLKWVRENKNKEDQEKRKKIIQYSNAMHYNTKRNITIKILLSKRVIALS